MIYYKFAMWMIGGAIVGYLAGRVIAWIIRRRRKHTHYCPCGNHWSHSETSAGDVEKHTCHDCGRQVWWVMR